MRTGLPNANYIAFTGTPLLGSKRLTNQWAIEKQNIVKERNAAKTKEQRDELTRILNTMNRVEMAVIVSYEDDEVEKFQQQGLDISAHRQKMNAVTPEGLDIEDRFKDPDDPLQLVFVCAMWLTGFDVESLSTLYLDKPMKGHTLMQAIARANRVYPGKPCGIIVDYVNVFKYMQKALSEYAAGDDGGEYPAKDIDKLIDLIDQTIGEADDFLKGLGIDIGAIIADASTFDRLDQLRSAFDTIVSHDESKEKFKVMTRRRLPKKQTCCSRISSTWQCRDMGGSRRKCLRHVGHIGHT